MNQITQNDLYLEIGCEELPCTYIPSACKFILSSFKEALLNQRFITPESTVTIESTPRRICLFVDSATIIQAPYQEVIWGPPKKFLKDQDNNWSKAALKFASKMNVSCQSFNFGTDPKGKEACYIKQNSIRHNLEQILPTLLDEILTKVPFPKTMRFWTGDKFSFARPIRWIVALWGDQTLTFPFHSIKSQKFSYGQRLQSGIEKITFNNASKESIVSTYEKAGLNISPQQRKSKLIEEMKQVLQEKVQNTVWEKTFDEDLLNDVVHLIESGKVLIGTFDSKFCQLPSFVLECVMKHHHKFFPVYSPQEILPFFISIVNGNPDPNIVLNGNQKVLHARFADAQFFIQEDLKTTLEKYASKLDSITIHPKIGTLEDKLQFMNQIAKEILSYQQGGLDLSEEDIFNTIKLSKADQLTQMVYEFPELQGKIGAFYARQQNINENICLAIEQQYDNPETLTQTLSQMIIICDQISLLLPAFQHNLKITGSKDPYGLRRASITLIKVMLSNKIWDLDLKVLFQTITQNDELTDQCISFCKERLTSILQKEYSIPHNIIQATINTDNFNVYQIKQKTLFLHEQIQENPSNIEEISEAFIRINKFLKPEEKILTEYDSSHFKIPSEKQLHQYISSNLNSFSESQLDKKVLLSLKTLAKKVHQLFLDVQIRSLDHDTTKSRIALLATTHQRIQQYCDWSKLTK